jgi:SAM-dependent methyltransferase
MSIEHVSPLKYGCHVRGDRLRPERSNRLFWHLQTLRCAVESVIQQFVEGKGLERLLDFGCGNMPYRPLFAPYVGDYIGCDLADNQLADLEVGDDGKPCLVSCSVDVVLSSQVLEHVPEPEGYLHECHRVLRPNGLLILSTHGVWKYHPDPQDFWRWTSAGLRRIIEATGFQIVHFEGIMGPAATALQLWQDSVLPRVPRILRSAFVRFVQARIQRADVRCPDEVRQRDAGTYLVVAETIN